MKIAAARIESWLEKPSSEVCFFLIYGPDQGLVQQRFLKLKNLFIKDDSDPFSSCQIDYDQLKKDPALLLDEINAFSLYGGKKVVLLRNMASSPLKLINEALSETNDNAIVLMEAGDLPPSSSLRKLCEKHQHCVAIPCYKDDNRGIRQVISQFFLKNEVKCDSQAMELLSNSFGGDRMVVISELEKLLLYIGDSKEITLSDVEDCIVNSAELVLDELCYAFMSLDGKKCQEQFDKALQEGAMPVVILRSLARYTLRLLEGHILLQQGKSYQQIPNSLRPPIFFKYQEKYLEHLRMWPKSRLEGLLDHLTSMEKDCKTTGLPTNLLCQRFIAIIPAMMRKR